jgi:hypothetical protein
MIANHINLLGIAAKWQFFEAGHGKGPCDGIGAFVKRMADGAVKREKQIIQDAHGFYCHNHHPHQVDPHSIIDNTYL